MNCPPLVLLQDTKELDKYNNNHPLLAGGFSFYAVAEISTTNMNVLIAYDGFEIEYCNGRYYHNFLNDIIKRYSFFGSLTIFLIIKIVEKPTCDEVDLSSVRIINLTKINSIVKLLKYSKRNTQLIVKAVSESDFVIAHLPSSAADKAIITAKKQGKPVFSLVIGCPFDSLWNYDWRGKLLAPFSYLCCRNSVRRSDFVQYVTNYFLQNRYPSNRKQIGCSDVCIDMIDIDTASKVKERWNNRHKESICNIVTCASVGAPYKGQQYVIEAIAVLNAQGYNFHYHLFGGGSQSRLRDLAKSFKITEYIHFYGNVEHQVIMNCLKTMDIYAQPSLQEGLPRSIIEAMSVGLPIIASDNVGGMNELTQPNMRFKKKCVDGIVSVLRQRKDIWIKSSAYSVNKSKDFDYNVLKSRRDQFFKMIQYEIQGEKY